jgi:hypothetical protein
VQFYCGTPPKFERAECIKTAYKVSPYNPVCSVDLIFAPPGPRESTTIERFYIVLYYQLIKGLGIVRTAGRRKRNLSAKFERSASEMMAPELRVPYIWGGGRLNLLSRGQ